MGENAATSYPLLRRLTLVQLAAFGLLIAIVIGVLLAMSTSHKLAYESQLRQVVKPKIELEQERWRSWAALGLSEALSDEINRVKSSLPVKDIRVIDRKDLQKPDPDATIIIPELDDGISSFVVVATVGGDQSSQSVPVDTYVLLALAAALIAFLGVVVYSNLFIRAKIYEPIRKLNQALTQPAELRQQTMAAVSAVGEIKVFVDSFTGLYEQARQAETYAAVAQMTQMLAHDVRKPFSILRMGLGMLGSAKDPAAVKSVLSRLVPEIDKAVSSVDGLISDVMEVGSTSTQLIQEPASPESLIEATLGEVFRIYPNADVSLTYDLRHAHMANVHVQKVGRVFSNIVGNAIQAMGKKGGLWFKTREIDGMIEFCLGNAGSVIPTESLPKLFDAFFTSGKKGGTGLGLAIAQKVVKAHGGDIWCESSTTEEHPKGKVEFFFTLPIADDLKNKTTANLPKHSSEITKAIKAMAEPVAANDRSVDKGELTLESDIVQASDRLGRPWRVLVVDDESVYRHALASFLARTIEMERAVTVVKAEGAEQALSAVAATVFDLVITDVDMGPESLNGFELVSAMRDRGHTSLICVHSNRIVAADHKKAIFAGADAFVPKPMARAQLLRLLLQAVDTVVSINSEPAALTQQQCAVAVGKTKPEIAIIDDNPFILDAWEDKLKADAIVHLFASLEELSERLDADPKFAGNLMLAITDLNLDGSTGDGTDVGRLLKRHRPHLRVLLSSDCSVPLAEYQGAIDLAIGKDPVGLAALSAL